MAPYYGGSLSVGGGAALEIGDGNADLDIFAIKQNDTEPYLRRTLVDGAGAPIDLTDVTAVEFHMAVPGSSAKVSAAAVIIDAVGGVVEYQWAAGDTDTVGSYRGEFQLTRSSGKVRTIPTGNWLRIKVYAQLN